MQIKLFITIILVTLIIFTGCKKEDLPETEKIKITVSLPTYKGITEKIGGDKVEVNCMLPAGFNPEEFEPTIQNLTTAADADLYIRCGEVFDFENIWLEKLSVVKGNIPVYDSSPGIIIKDHNHHVWNGTGEVKIIAGNIYETLKSIDSLNSDYYKKNYSQFMHEIDSVDNIAREKLSGLKTKTILTYHPAWIYFTSYYGLEEMAIENHGKEPGAKDLTFIINKAKSLGIKAVFIQPQFVSNTAKLIAGEIGGSLVVIDPLPEDFLENVIDVTNKIIEYDE